MAKTATEIESLVNEFVVRLQSKIAEIHSKALESMLDFLDKDLSGKVRYNELQHIKVILVKNSIRAMEY